MNREEKVKEIVVKYNRSITQLLERGTIKEAKMVFKYMADEANRKQRELVGLDDPE